MHVIERIKMKNIFTFLILSFLTSPLAHTAPMYCNEGYTFMDSGECIRGEYLVCISTDPKSAKIELELLPDQTMTLLLGGRMYVTQLEYPTLLDLDSRNADEIFKEFHFDKDTLSEFKSFKSISKLNNQHLFTYFKLRETSFHEAFRLIKNENNHTLYNCKKLTR
jgi:hypothetical protein